jgi:hypothetical protein
MKNYSVKKINDVVADVTGSVTLPIEIALPTPQIARRSAMAGIQNPTPNPKDTLGQSWKQEIEGISPKEFNISDLLIVDYPDEYYKEQFDIYFNSFGDREWLNLPDKRLELCMVRNGKKSRKAGAYNSTTPLNESYKGNKDRYTNAIVHPANTSDTNPNIFNTIYSGGNAGAPNPELLLQGLGPWHNSPTEWKLDETDPMFSQDGIAQSGLNRLNNPNITVELDIRNFIKEYVNYFTRDIIEYPINMETTQLQVKGLGRMTQTTINKVYLGTPGEFSDGEFAFHRRNPTLFFRLSAGDPKTAKLGSSAKYYFDFNSALATVGETVNIDLGYGNTIDNLVVVGDFMNQFHQVVNDEYSNKYRCKFNKNNGITIEKLVNSNNLYEPVPFVPTITNLDSETTYNATQIRAADPATFYQKRLFSDLSQPVKIKLKIGKFFVDCDEPTLGYTQYAYGHKTTIG